MLWVLLLGLHLIGLVGYSILLRRQAHAQKVHPWVLATILHTAIAIPFLLVALFVHPDLSRFSIASIGMVALSVSLSILLQITIVKALQYLEAGSYAVLYTSRIVFATILAALFLSEIPSIWTITGGVLILLAVFVLRQKSNKKVTKLGVLWGFAAAATASSLAITEKWLINDVGLFTAGPTVVLLAAIAMWLVVAIRKYPVVSKELFTKQMSGMIVFRVVAAIGWVAALAAGALVSVATYVSSLSVVIVAVLGVLILKEKNYLIRKVAAVVLAVAGLSVILLL